MPELDPNDTTPPTAGEIADPEAHAAALASGALEELPAFGSAPTDVPATIELAAAHLRRARLLLDQARASEGRSAVGRYLANANTTAETAELWCSRASGRA